MICSRSTASGSWWKIRCWIRLRYHALVFVWLAHDRRFVGEVLVLFVLFVFIRISGRHRVAHDHEGTPVDQPGGKFLGDVWGHVNSLNQADRLLAVFLFGRPLPCAAPRRVRSDDGWIRKSSRFFPDLSCAVSQRGCFPRPAQVSDGRVGFLYFGKTCG